MDTGLKSILVCPHKTAGMSIAVANNLLIIPLLLGCWRAKIRVYILMEINNNLSVEEATQ
jgi:hypothetical protein